MRVTPDDDTHFNECETAWHVMISFSRRLKDTFVGFIRLKKERLNKNRWRCWAPQTGFCETSMTSLSVSNTARKSVVAGRASQEMVVRAPPTPALPVMWIIMSIREQYLSHKVIPTYRAPKGTFAKIKIYRLSREQVEVCI